MGKRFAAMAWAATIFLAASWTWPIQGREAPHARTLVPLVGQGDAPSGSTSRRANPARVRVLGKRRHRRRRARRARLAPNRAGAHILVIEHPAGSRVDRFLAFRN